MVKKFIFFSLFLLFISLNLTAATGCLVGSRVYQTTPSFPFQWTNPIQVNCPSGASSSTQYANVTSNSSVSCDTGFFGFGPSGVIVTYNILNCPIDDYIPLMLLAAGGVGVFFLRNNSLLPISQAN